MCDPISIILGSLSAIGAATSITTGAIQHNDQKKAQKQQQDMLRQQQEQAQQQAAQQRNVSDRNAQTTETLKQNTTTQPKRNMSSLKVPLLRTSGTGANVGGGDVGLGLNLGGG